MVFQSPQAGQGLCNRQRSALTLGQPHISVPSSGARPLQSSYLPSCSLKPSLFQSPQAGQGLCNRLTQRKTRHVVRVFQSPQAGQGLCNSFHLSDIANVTNFSPLKRGKASAIRWLYHWYTLRSNFSPLKRGKASAIELQQFSCAFAINFSPLKRGKASAIT